MGLCFCCNGRATIGRPKNETSNLKGRLTFRPKEQNSVRPPMLQNKKAEHRSAFAIFNSILFIVTMVGEKALEVYKIFAVLGLFKANRLDKPLGLLVRNLS